MGSCRCTSHKVSAPTFSLILEQWFSTQALASPREHLVVCGGIFGCHKWEKNANGIEWNSAICPHNKMLSVPKCLYYRG